MLADRMRLTGSSERVLWDASAGGNLLGLATGVITANTSFSLSSGSYYAGKISGTGIKEAYIDVLPLNIFASSVRITCSVGFGVNPASISVVYEDNTRVDQSLNADASNVTYTLTTDISKKLKYIVAGSYYRSDFNDSVAYISKIVV